jgi:hypothetical protein
MAISPELKGVLDLRLAHGEISVEEYRSLLAVLGEPAVTSPENELASAESRDADPWQSHTLLYEQASTVPADATGSSTQPVVVARREQREETAPSSARYVGEQVEVPPGQDTRTDVLLRGLIYAWAVLLLAVFTMLIVGPIIELRDLGALSWTLVLALPFVVVALLGVDFVVRGLKRHEDWAWWTALSVAGATTAFLFITGAGSPPGELLGRILLSATVVVLLLAVRTRYQQPWTTFSLPRGRELRTLAILLVVWLILGGGFGALMASPATEVGSSATPNVHAKSRGATLGDLEGKTFQLIAVSRPGAISPEDGIRKAAYACLTISRDGTLTRRSLTSITRYQFELHNGILYVERNTVSGRWEQYGSVFMMGSQLVIKRNPAWAGTLYQWYRPARQCRPEPMW